MDICREKEYIYGLMVVGIRVTLLRTREKVLEFLNGEMEEYMRVNGKMACNRVKEGIKVMMVVGRVVSGRKEDYYDKGYFVFVKKY